MKYLILSLLAFSSLAAQADDHANVATSDGAFITMMAQSDDPMAYIDALKSNTAVFEASGTDAAGYCLTRSGHDHPGQMFIWNAFSSLELAMQAPLKYDPMLSPEQALTELRTVKYGVTGKPLKPFKLDPGYERMLRVEVPGQHVAKFVAGIAAVEQAVQSAGHDMNLGVFEGIGGGKHEANILHVRAVAQDAASLGKVLDEYYAGASFGAPWNEAFALVTGVRSDYMQECAQLYSAQ